VNLFPELKEAGVGVENYFQYAPERIFFSFFYSMESSSGGHCTGAGSDYLDKGREANDEGLKRFLMHISGLECKASPTRPA
jgi:hypothetical protein